MRNTRPNYFSGACLIAALLATACGASATDLTGAGATFPYPVYAKWAEDYKLETRVQVNYQAIGSGGGIRQIEAGTVAFGASDKPLTQDELEKNALMQFPTVMGGIVPVVNIDGIESGKLKLDGRVLADIYLAKIRKWNDPAITALNPGVSLPAADINVVHRTDGSGTTFLFTDYLSKVSPEWKSRVGEDTMVSWKTGTGGRGNEGVASYVRRIKNSIGYVEYAYAFQNKMACVQLRNHDGRFVAPTEKSFKAAAAGARWDKAPDFYEVLTDEPGESSWPIAGATFILMRKNQERPATAIEVLRFFDWAYAKGDMLAESMGYIPMPDDVVAQIHTAWKTRIRDTQGNAVWK